MSQKKLKEKRVKPFKLIINLCSYFIYSTCGWKKEVILRKHKKNSEKQWGKIIGNAGRCSDFKILTKKAWKRICLKLLENIVNKWKKDRILYRIEF